MLKDHLGNTRVVLTDELQQDVYPAATVELQNTAAPNTEQAYYAINTTDVVPVSSIPSWGSTTGGPINDNNGNPQYNNNPAYTLAASTAQSQYVYHLNPALPGGNKTGLGITLKVMAGDAVDIWGKSFWHNNTSANPDNSSYPIAAAVQTFINALAGTPAVANAGKGATGTALYNSADTRNGVTSLLNGVPTPTQATIPKAYINWILFDEQFTPVGSSSFYDAVNTTKDVIKNHHQTVNIPKGGYLYVYCSNESNADMYFDNLQLIHTRGPLLETDSYYPFGLSMAGISSQAAGKLENLHKYNKGSELQHKEFSDGSGLELYATEFRSLDPQIGKWNQIDPDIEDGQENESPYQAMADDPIRYNDPLGNTPCCDFSLPTVWQVLQWKEQAEAQADPEVGLPLIEIGGDIAALGALVWDGLTAWHNSTPAPAPLSLTPPALTPPATVTAPPGAVAIPHPLSPPLVSVKQTKKQKEEAAQAAARARQNAAMHRTGASASKSDTHTARRSGGRYNDNQNNKRGNSNKKFKPKPNPNKK